MFCSQCGAENKENKFCSQCGNPITPIEEPQPASAEPAAAAPLPVVDPSQPAGAQTSAPPKSNKGGLITAVVLLVILSLGAAAWWLSPSFSSGPSINFESASSLTLRPIDFEFPLKPQSDPTTLLERDSPFLGSDECYQQTQITSALRGATVIAEKYYSSEEGSKQLYLFEQQFLAFRDEGDLLDLMNAIRSGVSNSLCGYNSEYLMIRNYGLSTAEEEFGAGGEDSIFFNSDMEVDSEYLTLDWREIFVLIPQENNLLVIRGLVEIPGNTVNYNEMYSAVSLAIDTAYGLEP